MKDLLEIVREHKMTRGEACLIVLGSFVAAPAVIWLLTVGIIALQRH